MRWSLHVQIYLAATRSQEPGGKCIARIACRSCLGDFAEPTRQSACAGQPVDAFLYHSSCRGFSVSQVDGPLRSPHARRSPIICAKTLILWDHKTTLTYTVE